MSDEIKIIEPHKCDKCGKLYGKTNATYQGVELWQSCDCQSENIAYLVNTKKIQQPPLDFLDEAEFLDKVGNG